MKKEILMKKKKKCNAKQGDKPRSEKKKNVIV